MTLTVRRQHVGQQRRVDEVARVEVPAGHRHRVRDEVRALVEVVAVGQAVIDAPQAQPRRHEQDQPEPDDGARSDGASSAATGVSCVAVKAASRLAAPYSALTSVRPSTAISLEQPLARRARTSCGSSRAAWCARARARRRRTPRGPAPPAGGRCCRTSATARRPRRRRTRRARSARCRCGSPGRARTRSASENVIDACPVPPGDHGDGASSSVPAHAPSRAARRSCSAFSSGIVGAYQSLVCSKHSRGPDDLLALIERPRGAAAHGRAPVARRVRPARAPRRERPGVPARARRAAAQGPGRHGATARRRRGRRARTPRTRSVRPPAPSVCFTHRRRRGGPARGHGGRRRDPGGAARTPERGRTPHPARTALKLPV